VSERTGHDWLPLTAAQRGLFFAHQLDPGNPCYTTAEVVECDGRVDVAGLRAALSAAYADFEQLRVEFALRPDGPVQRGRPPSEVDLAVVEVAGAAEAEAWMAAEVLRPFDLLGGPATRVALLRLPDVDLLFHAAHHVLLDGYGVQQLLRRVADHLGGAPKPLPGVTLQDLVEAEETSDSAADAFWAERLAGYEGPASLAGHVAAAAPAALRAAIDVPDELQHAVVAAARRLGTPWADLITVAVGSYLARMTSQRSIRVGLPLMNRTRAGVGALPAAHTVCTAMNVVPVTIPGRGTVADALVATAAEQAAIRTSPFTRVEELTRRLGVRGQLFGAQVNVIPFDLELRLGPVGEQVSGVVRNLTAGPVEDLTVGLRGVPGRGRRVRLELDANPRLYDADEVTAHLPRLLAWLRRWAEAEPHDEIDDLPLVEEAERRRVVEEFNDTGRPRSAATLGRRFAEAARTHPDAAALRFGEETLTYSELEERARRIASGLAAAGVRAGDVVGLRLERSTALYEALHAVILLGAVYLPLDPDLPEDRIATMLADAGAAVVVDDVERFVAATAWEGVHDEVGSTAYLLFTSGSTGRPKGVEIAHAAIDNRLAWMQDALPLAVGDRVLHKTPISFDVSIWELFWPLQVGACVEIAPPGAHRDPRALATLLDGVAVVHFVPSMLRAFLADRVARDTLQAQREAGRGLRHLVTSGEALTPDLVDGAVRWCGTAPVNLYGPTEAAVDVTVWRTDPAEATVPIGTPIWNTSCLVLDQRGRPVPVGAVGELWLGGVQLATGYVGRADLTAERFVETAYGRLYRTGDLAAWRPDGALRYLGRTDDQVKVRGQRVELGEIEAVLTASPGVLGAVAGVVDDRLVCWVQGEVDLAALRAAAAASLPPAWVPGRWVVVDAIPLGTSGKADRRALVARTPAADPDEAGSVPGTLVEQRLAELVGVTLGRGAVPVAADFFELGGDSLAVLGLLGEIEAEWGIELELAAVFGAPRVVDLAVVVESALAGEHRTGTGFEEILTLRAGRPGEGVAPLFLLPPAGGLGWCYTSLLRHLPAEVPVHTVQARGLAEGVPESVSTLTELAVRQLSAIRHVVGDGPFHLAGWSLGGMAAHAVAVLARRQGQQVGEVVLLDAYPPEQWATLAEPTEADALLGLLRLGAATVPDGTVLTRERVARALRESGSALAALPEQVVDGCVASVLEAARLVRTSTPGVLPGGATLVVATAPRPETWLDPSGWDSHTAGTVDRVDVACGHGELVRREEVGRLLGERLALHLRHSHGSEEALAPLVG
jgi:enterobactin synthetase component F